MCLVKCFISFRVSLIEADLHNLVRLKVVKTQIPMARSLCYLKGIGTVVICCHEGQVLQVVDIEDKVMLKASHLKDRASLVTDLKRRGESCDGTVKYLKQRLEACLLGEQRMFPQSRKNSRHCSFRSRYKSLKKRVF